MNQPKFGVLALLLTLGALFGIGAALWLGRLKGVSVAGRKAQEAEDPLFI